LAERPLTRKKYLGAYYTAPAAVDFLVAWGLAVAPGTVMDPSCGDGRFLVAAARGGATALVGCDLDTEALARAERALAETGPPATLQAGDFFQLDPQRLGPIDLVVGNPPFIRYQQFSGESRTRALSSALRVGARLTRLATSWAPFLLHALQFLRPGGAMAMVVPAELAQTTYGVTTLRALCANFSRIRLVAFRRNWFEDAQQETFLLLAEGRGGTCASAELIPLERTEDLAALPPGSTENEGVPLAAGRRPGLGLAFLDPAARGLIRELTADHRIVALQSIGEVSNGYVTGANAFFHCTAQSAAMRGLPTDWLLPVARNSRSLAGLHYGRADIAAAESRGTPHHLIYPQEDDLLCARRGALDALVHEGERTGIAARYKCRVRNPWWRVPGTLQAQVLLPYMIGAEPHGAVNGCHALYSNSLHGIRLAEPAAAGRVVLGLLSALSLLSMELEGRSYGGGVLKLEPTEMQRVRLILPDCPEPRLRERLDEADALVRRGEFAAAAELADRLILKTQLGLADADIERLRRARGVLLERRLARSRTGR
jgi:predicted RNA methylase